MPSGPNGRLMLMWFNNTLAVRAGGDGAGSWAKADPAPIDKARNNTGLFVNITSGGVYLHDHWKCIRHFLCY